MRLAIIIPTLDEAGGIVRCLDALAGLRAAGHVVIVVDGGSGDDTRALAAGRADRVCASERGRARQMNAGAEMVLPEIDTLLFLHADTLLPADADRHIRKAFERGARWGRFDVRIAGRSRWFPIIARLMNLRSCVTGIATGDQGIFVGRELFERVGGYPDLALMEDIALSQRLLREGRPACLRARVVTSGRRWERDGVWRTILLMWRLRWRYRRGASPDELAREYA